MSSETSPDGGLLEAFGYDPPRPGDYFWMHHARVDEGMYPTTLEPVVILWLRASMDDDLVGWVTTPTMAEQVAKQLLDAADRARARDFRS